MERVRSLVAMCTARLADALAWLCFCVWCTDAHVLTNMSVCAHIHKYACIHVRINMNLHTHVHACAHARTHNNTYTHTHTHTRLHSHTHIHTHTHTHTHTHIHCLGLQQGKSSMPMEGGMKERGCSGATTAKE